MNDSKRLIFGFFVVATVLAAFVLSRGFAALAVATGVADPALLGENLPASRVLGLGIALVTSFVLYRNPRVAELSTEVAAELQKVTWPAREETQLSTKVVILTVVVFAVVLGVYDFFSAGLTGYIY